MSDTPPDAGAAPPLMGSPVMVASNIVNGRVMLDANDVVSMLLTRGKEANSLEAEQLCWQLAQWIQGLVLGTVQGTLGQGKPLTGFEPVTEQQQGPEGPPAPGQPSQQ